MKSSSASSTARAIAAATILLYHSGRTHLVSKEARDACEALLKHHRSDRLLAWSAQSRFTRPVWWLIEKLTLPGIVEHYWYRKKAIEAECREAIADGYRRVAVLGAGLDTLALRLIAEFPEVEWIEYDHPATQTIKRRYIQSNKLDLELAPLDLGTSGGKWPIERKKTVFIAEGLLMYFNPEKVKEIFKWAEGGDKKDNRIIFTYMEKVDAEPIGFRPRSRAIDFWLRAQREPFLWHLSRTDSNSFFEDISFSVLNALSADEMREAAGVTSSGIRGENLMVVQSKLEQRQASRRVLDR